ncbi:cytidylyltransferase domain-containing protein [Candidatus Omnitrophota bacterium]
MRDSRSILAVVPAHGGSKGIKLKNLLKLDNKTLIEHVANAIRECDFIDEAVVSTDHELIKEEAVRVGLKAPFRRPKDLLGDFISDIQVLRHAIKECGMIFNRTFDVILMLQPTSPIRSRKQILDCIDSLIANKLDSCFTVSKTDSKAHPLKQLRMKDNKISYYDPEGERIIARQMLGTVYHRNGVCYAFTRKCIMKKGKIITDNSSAIVIDEFTVNIDNMYDVRLAELHFKGAL